MSKSLSRVALVALVLALSSPPWVATVQAVGNLRVQCTAFIDGGTTANCSLVGVQAGDLLTIALRERDGNAPATFTSDLDGTFTLAVTRSVSAARASIYYLKNASAGTHVVTVTFAGGSSYDFNAAAFGGAATTGGADTTNNNGSASTTSHSHGSITPSASAIIITSWGGADNGGETPGGDGMTALNNTGSCCGGRQYFQYKVGHTGAIDGDFTTTNSVAFDAVIAAFLESGGAAAAPCTRSLLGVGCD